MYLDDVSQSVMRELARIHKRKIAPLNPTFHVREQNPSGCWGFALRSSLHSRFRRVGSFA